jgi:hypothetical protein
MKRFVITVLGAAVFFLGLGAIVESTGAMFKSDERALELVRQARQALGGDAAIAAIESMKIAGQTTQTFDIDGTSRTEQGEMEIALQFPDKHYRTMRFGGGESGEKRSFDVMMVDRASDPAFTHGVSVGSGEGKSVHTIVRSADGKTEVLDPAAAAEILARRHRELAATGEGSEKTKTFVFTREGHEPLVPSEGTQIFMRKAEVEAAASGGTNEHKIIVRKSDGTFEEADSARAVLLDRVADERVAALAGTRTLAPSASFGLVRQNDMLRTTLSLLLTAPKGVDVTYTFGGEAMVDGTACNIVVATSGGSVYRIYLSQTTSLPVAMSYTGVKAPRVLFNRDTVSTDAGPVGRTTYKTAEPSNAEVMVKYTDYRSVNGVQLPFKWTQTSGGSIDEVFDVTSYEINPADIGEKFQNHRVFVPSKKAGQ